MTTEPIRPKLAWVDTETSGLEPTRDRIIEIAIVITDEHLNVFETFERKIKLSPSDRLAASPQALLVNGYTDAEWADAVPSDAELWGEVHRLTDGALLAGQNVTQFDSKFIAAEMMRFNLRPRWDRRMQDTMGDAIRAMYAFDVKAPNRKGELQYTAGLEHVYKALGGPDLPAHRAMADVKRAMYVYKIFHDAFLVALKRVPLINDSAAFEDAPHGEGYDGDGRPAS
jgi:exonuclease I